jgi:AraC-like DNA-binding protein
MADDRLRLSRSMTWAAPGLLRVRQGMEVRHRELGADATGPYWVFAIVKVRRGRIRYLHGRGLVVPPGPCFALFMPPWSIVRTARTACDVTTDAVVSAAPVFEGAPPRPIAWRWRGGRAPLTAAEIAAAVRGAASAVEISREVDAARAARQAKALVDQAYSRPVTLGRLAAESGVSASVMSRAFRQAFGMSAVEYRHRLRIMDALFRIASGGDILSVLDDVGFGDASRLYSHFRSLLCSPPGSHRTRTSKNAKT